MQNEDGFTLIELLIVILIIGIITSVTLLSIGDFGQTREVKTTAEQFLAYIKLVQQKAILEIATLGIMINHAGYETYRYLNDNKTWQPLPKKSLIFHRFFPKKLIVTLQNKLKNTNQEPDIIISPSG